MGYGELLEKLCEEGPEEVLKDLEDLKHPLFDDFQKFKGEIEVTRREKQTELENEFRKKYAHLFQNETT